MAVTMPPGAMGAPNMGMPPAMAMKGRKKKGGKMKKGPGRMKKSGKKGY